MVDQIIEYKTAELNFRINDSYSKGMAVNHTTIIESDNKIFQAYSFEKFRKKQQEVISSRLIAYDLDNLLRSGSIKEPDKIGGRRVWSPHDIQRAAKAIRIRRAKRPMLTLNRSTLNQSEEY